MTKVQFVSPLQSEIDVVGLGLTFERDEIKEVSDEDAELLLRSSAFARVDEAAATAPQPTSTIAAPETKPERSDSKPEPTSTNAAPEAHD